MCKFNSKNDSRRIDPCMSSLITYINSRVGQGVIVACCCGHGKYPMTLVERNIDDSIVEVLSGVEIPRKKKFYKKDEEGHYYIPEVCSVKSGEAK